MIAVIIELVMEAHRFEHLVRLAQEVRGPSFRRSDKMPVSMQKSYDIQMNDSPVWKVRAVDLRIVEGVELVRVLPYKGTFVKLVCHGVVDVPDNIKNTASLGNTRGWHKLMELRNKAGLPQPSEVKAEPKTVAQMLFGAAAPAAPKKQRQNAAELAALRSTPTLMNMEVPGVDDGPALAITMIKPVHPCDELWVRCDADTVEQIVKFIQHCGIEREDIYRRRVYQPRGRGDADDAPVHDAGGAEVESDGERAEQVADDAETQAM